MGKKSRQKFKYLENEKSFQDEIKTFFFNFEGLSVAKNCLRPETAPSKGRHFSITRFGILIFWNILHL